jgi:replicative DNA helicase Mcm
MVLQFDMGARWRGFLEEVCHESITNLSHVWPEEQSIEVRYGDLQAYDPDFAADVLLHPNLSLDAARRTLKALLQDLGVDADAELRLIELPLDHRFVLREIRNKHISPLIAIEGIVSKITSVRPMITIATFRCICGHDTVLEQLDESKMTTPLMCEEHEGGCGREDRKTRFTIVHEESAHLDTQTVEIQELPEKVKSGQSAEVMLCYLQGDLSGVLSPGNRVVLNGRLYRRAQRKGGKDTPIFDLIFKCHSFERKNIPLEEVTISDEEKEMILNYSKREDLDSLLMNSIAPSIFGNYAIKRSLVLQLFGGVSRINSDGTRSRGDIHILLMGDPGVAKSQLLNYMVALAPRGQFASGMSSSSAGLTAAAVQHPDGGWTVEAGALPLADMGLACIDEFDKMNEQDRSAMHEAMEQQKISIHKATVHTTMRTRCSILAAANPSDGKFIHPQLDPKARPYSSQILLSKPLLSRFDCIWLMLDQPDNDDDRRIGLHISKYRQTGTPEWLIDEGISTTPSSRDAADGTIDSVEIIEPDMFQKYIAYAKKNIHPTLSDAAREKVVDYYVQLRTKGGGINAPNSQYTDGKNSGMEEIGGKNQHGSLTSVPISPRAIESLVRMAEAYARTRLRDEVIIEDAELAIATLDTWRYELMGKDYDETSIVSGKTTTKRNREHHIVSFIIQQYQKTDQTVELFSILNEMEKHSISKSQVEEILDSLCNGGTLFRPLSNRDEYQPT